MSGKGKDRGPTQSLRESMYHMPNPALLAHYQESRKASEPKEERSKLRLAPQVPCSTQEWPDPTLTHKTPSFLSTVVQSAKETICLPRHAETLELEVLFVTLHMHHLEPRPSLQNGWASTHPSSKSTLQIGACFRAKVRTTASLPGQAIM